MNICLFITIFIIESVKIFGSKTGLGNQIQFIPIVRKLQEKFRVCSDSDVFYNLGVIESPKSFESNHNITVFGYNYKSFWHERLGNRGKFYGFKYRIKRRHFGFGYSKSIQFDEDLHEIDNNVRLYNHCFKDKIFDVEYKLDGWQPIKNRVIVGISPKKEKTLPFELWSQIIKNIQDAGYEVQVIDRDINQGIYVSTPTLRDLKDCLCKASYYIGTDSGVMHLADIIGIPSLIMFGSTSIIKNRPKNSESIVLSRDLQCSPCFDWGRVQCTNDYKCMAFTRNEIMEQFEKLIQKKNNNR